MKAREARSAFAIYLMMAILLGFPTAAAAGSILISDPFPGSQYGVVVGDHAGSPNGGAYATCGALARGGFYEILDPSLATLTAKDALNNPGGAVYRPDAAVWLYDDPTTTSDLSYLGSGVVAINGFGNGTDNAEFLVTISGIPVTESFLQDLLAFGMTALALSRIDPPLPMRIDPPAC